MRYETLIGPTIPVALVGRACVNISATTSHHDPQSRIPARSYIISSGTFINSSNEISHVDIL